MRYLYTQTDIPVVKTPSLNRTISKGSLFVKVALRFVPLVRMESSLHSRSVNHFKTASH